MNLEPALIRARAIFEDRIFDPLDTDDSPAAQISKVNITSFFRDGVGWAKWKDALTGKWVTSYAGNRHGQWCGAFVAFCMLAAGLGKDARAACASTFKLWRRYPIGHAARVRPEAIEPGCVVVTRHANPERRKKWGDHITLAAGYANPIRYPTIEGNAKGRWPDGRWIEGVVENERQLSEVVVAYRIPEEEFTT